MSDRDGLDSAQRTLPASGTWASFWVYVVGPVLGANIGVFAYGLVRGPRPSPTLDRQSKQATYDG